eukprot:4428259-Pleurochrysis_carterae.AAC.3
MCCIVALLVVADMSVQTSKRAAKAAFALCIVSILVRARWKESMTEFPVLASRTALQHCSATKCNVNCGGKRRGKNAEHRRSSINLRQSYHSFKYASPMLVIATFYDGRLIGRGKSNSNRHSCDINTRVYLPRNARGLHACCGAGVLHYRLSNVQLESILRASQRLWSDCLVSKDVWVTLVHRAAMVVALRVEARECGASFEALC